MTKSSTAQLNEDEMKVIVELQKNSRENVQKIAKRSGFSQQKAARIIKQLENNHMIWGYTTIFNVEPQGLQKFIVSIKRSSKPLEKKSMNEIEYERLEKIIFDLGVTIESSYFIHGQYDWVLIILAKDILHARKFADILLTAYPGIVDKVNLSQILYRQRDHLIANPDQIKLMEVL
jgi:DNA-binding Lrp family transcriptional regulator